MTTDSASAPNISLRDGTTIPQLGFGTLGVQPYGEVNDANAELTAGIVSAALDAGYRHIDTAQAYGTERGVGDAIAASGIPRHELYITSKLANTNHAPDDVRRSFEQTLNDLRLDHLDLFLIHWPLPTRYGGDYVSTWEAVAGLVADGRLRSAGVSNFLPHHLDRIIDKTAIAPVVNQIEIHPYFANHAMREACARHGIAIEAYSPLGHSGEPLTDPVIIGIADKHGKTPAQVILRWHIQHRHIAIPKSTRPERMRENLTIFDFELTTDEISTIDTLDRGQKGRIAPDPDTYQG